MSTLSVCMIVKNEADILDECLEQAAQFADEIVVVDTGSTDATREIARRYACTVRDFAWNGSFADARNYAFSLGRCDYLLSVDADERFSADTLRQMPDLKQRMTGDVILVWCERPEFGTRALQPRIARRTGGPYWEGTVHESLRLQGTVAAAPITLLHRHRGPLVRGERVELIDRLPARELQTQFWLCANCWLDLVLAGETEKAARLFQYLENNPQPYEEKRDVLRLLQQALQTRNRTREAGQLLGLSLRALARQRRERS